MEEVDVLLHRRAAVADARRVRRLDAIEVAQGRVVGTGRDAAAPPENNLAIRTFRLTISLSCCRRRRESDEVRGSASMRTRLGQQPMSLPVPVGIEGDGSAGSLRLSQQCRSSRKQAAPSAGSRPPERAPARRPHGGRAVRGAADSSCCRWSREQRSCSDPRPTSAFTGQRRPGRVLAAPVRTASRL